MACLRLAEKAIVQVSYGARKMALFMQNPFNAEKVKRGKMFKMIILGQKSLFLAFSANPR